MIGSKLPRFYLLFAPVWVCTCVLDLSGDTLLYYNLDSVGIYYGQNSVKSGAVGNPSPSFRVIPGEAREFLGLGLKTYNKFYFFMHVKFPDVNLQHLVIGLRPH